MVFSVGSRHSLSYVAESTYGTTPTAPAMLEFRNTDVSLNLIKDTFKSNEIRDDRMTADLRHGLRKVEGSVGFELSYADFDDILESAFFGTWTADVLKMGIAQTSFSMERHFSDITQYLVYTGCIANTMSLNIEPNAMVTGSFGFVGSNFSASGTALDSDVTAQAGNAPFDGFTGTISEGGSTIGKVSSLTIEIDNTVTPNYVVGADISQQAVAGSSKVSGTVNVYFDSLAEFNKFVNETESSINVQLEDPAGNTVDIDLPRIKYTGGSLDVSSTDEAIILPLPFVALLDETSGTNIFLTRS